MDKYTYDQFKNWLSENAQLADDLQTWVFYRYAVANGMSGDVEVSVDSADMVVYLALFYISSTKGNEYAFITTEKTLVDMLDTYPDVVKKALHSLDSHGLISEIREGDDLKITIQPVTAKQPHHHHHHDEDCHHDEDHEDEPAEQE